MKMCGLKNCDTCRRAYRALPEVEFVDVRATPVPRDVLERALAAFGEALVNRRSTTWRNIDAAERDTPPLDLLGKHPALMKRPLIEDGDTLYLGWDSTVQSALGVG